jgi:hypothetical protein
VPSGSPPTTASRELGRWGGIADTADATVLFLLANISKYLHIRLRKRLISMENPTTFVVERQEEIAMPEYLKFHSRHYVDFLFKNTEQNNDSFELLTLGQSPNLILTILSDQEYMSGVKEKLAMIAEYR